MFAALAELVSELQTFRRRNAKKMGTDTYRQRQFLLEDQELAYKELVQYLAKNLQ